MKRIAILILVPLFFYSCSNDIGELSFTDKNGNILNYHENSGLIYMHRPNHETYQLNYQTIDERTERSITIANTTLKPQENEVYLFLGNGKYYKLNDYKMDQRCLTKMWSIADAENRKTRDERRVSITESMVEIFDRNIKTVIDSLIANHYNQKK